MASRKFTCLAAILFALFALVVAARPRKQRKSSEAFLDCVVQQLCVCGIHDRWGDCYNLLTDETRVWLIEEANKCDLGSVTLEDIPFKDFAQPWCDDLPYEVKKKCFDELDPKFQARLRDTGMGLHGQKEAESIEKVRKCLEPNISFCANEPKGCMSEG